MRHSSFFLAIAIQAVDPLSYGKRSLDRISVDRNCHFSVDRNCGNQLIEFFDTFHLIES